MTPRRVSPARADAFAAELDVGLEGVCKACLCFVSFAIERGDPREVRSELFEMTPGIWYDGLGDTALAAARAALDRGVRDAEAAVADLERRGGRSVFARAIVRRLAVELTRRTRVELRLEELARDRLLRAPPEWN